MKHAYLALAALVSFAALLAGSKAKADDCFPLKRYATVELVPSRTLRPIIPVMIGDKRRMLVISTGGVYSDLTLDAAHDLGLATQISRVKIIATDGEWANRYTYLPSLTIGGITNQHVMFTITPHNGIVEPGNENVIGTLGPNILQNMDVDFDFGAHRVNFINQDHCEGQVVYWPHSAVAVVPMRLGGADDFDNHGPNPRPPSGHIYITAMLDGKELKAEVNTGGTRTTLNETVAETLFGFDPNAPDAKVLGHLGNGQDAPKTYIHRFGALDFEGVAVTNPDIVIIPDLIKQNIHDTPGAGSLIVDTENARALPDLTIGMTELSKLHVYIAYKERKLYLTAATPPAAASAQ